MERGLRRQLKIYNDFSMLTPEQMEELKLIRREEVEPNGTDKETV